MTNNIFKQARRFINRGNLINLVTAPKSLKYSIEHQISNGFGCSTETLLDRNFVHIASYTTKNAGDTLLPTVLRDLFDIHIGGIRWKAKHVYDGVGEREVDRFNQANTLVLGGGGLFLGDTNRNNISGWQWPISVESIRSLTPKIIVFAVGYNKFRGQDDFDNNFKSTVTALAEKAVFFGLRNHGSINSIKEYLPAELHEKVRYQPCMTTVLRNIYPEKFQSESASEDSVIALNCAFDRAKLRFEGRESEILRDIARAMKELAKNHRICYFSHTREDEVAMNALRHEGVPFTHVRLYDMPSSYVLECYKKVKLTIGMRGHAQMIPFGCGGAIISLISHNKMRWFLEDISCPDFGVEINSTSLYTDLLEKSNHILNNYDSVLNKLERARAGIWSVTKGNLLQIQNNFNTSK
jgi:polysaccharide pyruvyl transferase WcaK-like protein